MTPVLSIQGSATSLNCLPEGKLIVLTGPSGVGKGTLVRALLQRHPELYFSISVTTRAPRPGEIHGKQYYFVSRSEFQQMIEQNKLLEWAEFAGNYYGTPRDTVLEQISKGKCVLLEIELEGARQICQSFPDAKRIFIMPPSLAELEQRLRGRGQDSPEAIARRLQRAKDEISAASEFDIQIVNDDFDTALDAIASAVFSFCGSA
ncbi:guanylate kinase [Gloeocapsopsis dulcis]|uniref:Guanylate kinase n=1 Tax=Gloeocapsopsis dulcis AAB1 = 1H9 TaxID=1433147 RepID=A0A6N8FWX2_9CHRO|nr:guanylate kinase [Gloeocapsopsis dulcis]MUL37628.1 guanylate kinase [Gloeocapsopsis dulcis AAB1 = 1H9]WNN89237.1 guanylate kinase [Gloeocapsopsis dulcis]